MEKSDIIAGLRSALNRGYSLDFAKKSFINAGYNSSDIEDSAALIISGGEVEDSSSKVSSQTISNVSTSDNLSRPSAPIVPVSLPVSQNPIQQQPIQPYSQSPVQSSYKPLPRTPIQNQNYKPSTDEYGVPKNHGLGLVIVLSIVFLIVLGVLGMLIFKRDLVENLLRSWGLI